MAASEPGSLSETTRLGQRAGMSPERVTHATQVAGGRVEEWLQLVLGQLFQELEQPSAVDDYASCDRAVGPLDSRLATSRSASSEGLSSIGKWPPSISIGSTPKIFRAAHRRDSGVKNSSSVA